MNRIARRAKAVAVENSEQLTQQLEATLATAYEIADKVEAAANAELNAHAETINALEDRINGVRQQSAKAKQRIEHVATVRARFNPS